MRRRRAPWIAAAIGVVLVLLVVALATRPPASTRVLDSPLLGRAAPALEGRTIDGRPVDQAGLRGRWVLVNFFATWCVPCRQEHDDLVRFSTQHADAGDAVVVGIVYEDSASAVRRFREEEGGDWPMLTDPGGRLAVKWGVAGVPESFLIRPDGLVASKIVGGILYGELEELLARAKRGGQPDVGS